MNKLITMLWFDSQAEEAANFYVSTLPNSKIISMNRYGEGGPGKPGSVMQVEFEINGQRFSGLNGGPHFKFSPAVSLMVICKDQREVDTYWEKFLSGGGKESQCGWLSDRFGFSWQIIPEQLGRLLQDSDRKKASAAMQAMLKMKKIDVAELQRAFDGA